jgi:chorismate mutase/prephenate dehydratase
MTAAPLKVSYLGPAGTNAHLAALQAFATADLQAAPSIPAVFSAVEAGAQRGVVPVENSIEGGVSFTLNCLLDSKLAICGEVVIDIEHCLLSSDASVRSITRVYSHPQALAQCRNWLVANLPHAELIPWASTAGATLEVKGKPGAAAIANAFSGETHGVPVLARQVQDHEQNATRFIILASQSPGPSDHDKTSLAFSTPHEKGALLRALSIFDRANINLTRIESRPLPGQMWQYAFFTDLEGHQAEPNVRRALDELAQQVPPAGLFKVFGSYPKAR